MDPRITGVSNGIVSESIPAPADLISREGSERGRSIFPVSGRRSWIWPLLVVVLFCVPLFVNLGGFDLANDEAGHSFAVDVMLSRGDWLTPKSIPSEANPFLEKPPLKFWIVALPIRLGVLPHDEFGLRFWDAVFGSVAFLYVFAIGRMLGGPLCGFAAVMVLFVHGPLLVDHGLRSNNMEAPLLLAYSGGLFHFLGWRTAANRSRRRRHVLAAALYFVLGFMVKFVAALFLPAVFLLAALSDGDDRARLRRDWRLWLGAAAAAAALISPWFIYEYFKYGSMFVDTIFGAHVFTRFTSYLDPDHLHPWHYYLTKLFSELAASHTAALVLVGLALVCTRIVRTRWREGTVVLLWFVPVVAISFGTSKLYHYLYPYLPPVALVAGYGASVLVSACSSVIEPWLRKVERLVGDPARRLVRGPALRSVLTVIAVGAGVLALATYATGPVRLGVGGRLLLRNSSVLRPAVIAFAALILAGRLGTAIRTGVVLLVAAILPISAYRSQVASFSDGDDTLRTLRGCLQPIGAEFGTPADPRGPGVYVEAPLSSHSFVYYLRGLGPWWNRNVSSDATIYTTLHVPGQARPVFLSDWRYEAFTALVNGGDQALLDRAARKAGVDSDTMRAMARETPAAIVRFPREVLLLPGPYSVCAFAGRKVVRR